MRVLITAWIACAVLMAMTGCGKKLPDPADPNAGREALTLALNTWKNGGSQEELQNRNPAVYFNEPEWQAGKKLVRYEIKGQLEPFGRQLRANVLLSVQDKNGATKDMTIPYQVDTHEVVVIAREF